MRGIRERFVERSQRGKRHGVQFQCPRSKAQGPAVANEGRSFRGRPSLSRTFWVTVAISLGCVTLAVAEDWPSWRGSQRTGILNEASGWNGSRWIDSKPTWTANVGEGASSPLLIGEQVFTLGHRDGQNIVSCLESSPVAIRP